MSDDFEDELDEREDPEPEDADWNLDPAPMPCPYCGGDIFDIFSRLPFGFGFGSR